MFRRVPLEESFEFVASPEEWQTFRSCGELTAIDCWIDSFRISPSKDAAGRNIETYCRLRQAFIDRVQDRLRSGDWICESFDPAKRPELQAIPHQLWSSVAINPFEDKAMGAGFQFVGLLISAVHSHKGRRPTAAGPPGRIRLGDAIEFAATPSEAAEYAQVKSAADWPWVCIRGSAESDNTRQVLCRRLQNQIWKRVLPKLTSGEWVADGFAAGSHQRTQISRELWPELQCHFGRDEVVSAPDLAIEFYRVMIDVRPDSTTSATPGTAWRRLSEWLREIAKGERSPVRRADLLQEAKAALGDDITLNLLDTCVRANGLGDVLLFRGRPPKKAADE